MGRTAIVSGGGGHLGLAIVRGFLEKGMTVAIFSSRHEKGEEARLRLPISLQDRCLVLACDVSDPQMVQKCFKEVSYVTGGIDILVNGAGFTDRHDLESIALQDWKKALGSSLNGCFVMMKEAIPYLEKSQTPRIINLSSVEAHNGGYESSVGTVTAKSGITALTRAAARELGRKGITVNCVAVGAEVPYTESRRRTEEAERRMLEQIPLGRFCRPEDVSPLVMFLASEAASYITGSVIDVNGGLFMG